MMNNTLLIELLTEELPPKALNLLGETFATEVANLLHTERFTDEAGHFTAYTTPRRLAVSIPNIAPMQADSTILRKGPSVQIGMHEGVATKALQGFARSCQVDITQLTTMHDGKQEIFCYEYTQKGQTLSEVLPSILQQAIKKLPIPKMMHWSDSHEQFVRPVHALSILHGNEVIAVNLLGLQSGRQTLGHRFLCSNPIQLQHANSYLDQLSSEGKVIPIFSQRREIIQAALTQFAQQQNATLVYDEDLLDEVCALVEYPVILQGNFDEKFLDVPQECLILTMQQNQKYFPLLDKNGHLMNTFLLVSNMQAADQGQSIIKGNEKVLRARLSDARFFYLQDKKHSLESRLPKLEQVVYHNKIGSQAQRIQRLIRIATALAPQLNANLDDTRRATQLAKADLVTEMVGEFPELQGIMGYYYALNDNENTTVARAIAEHYQPRSTQDNIPQNPVSIAVALADKLEALIGIWGIGLKPTGDKDPYALRRHVLGILRILMHCSIKLKSALQLAYDTFEPGILAADTVEEVLNFAYTRLAILLSADYSTEVITSVLSMQPDRLDDIIPRLEAVIHFQRLPESQALCAANKRVQNILKKAVNLATTPHINPALFQENDEKVLYNQINQLQPKIQDALNQNDFQEALFTLASIKPAVDNFFDHVMVMADDETVRYNRLNLLKALSVLLNSVANIAQL